MKNKTASDGRSKTRTQELSKVCNRCGEWLNDEELDPDLKEVFLGSVICFRCYCKWARLLTEE